ncbi:MAG: hypothetical protein P1U89_18190 [Verrucomicrobiales bacterium]|nr:hypothetical protein [Verrucomicrobiales bacterium]
MKTLTKTLAVLALLGSTAFSAKAQTSFQQQYESLSSSEQSEIRAEATQKEEYDQLPAAPAVLNSETVTEFCKQLPRGLETMQPKAGVNSATEQKRVELWVQHLSCQDSYLYYEGHRFFNSGHYTSSEIASAISEIKKVMDWLVKQEAALDSDSGRFSQVK